MDRISALPDDLHVRIISFLPTEEAVATGILSKKFKSLWRSLTCLHFNRRNSQNHPSFHRLVDNVVNSVDLRSVRMFVLHYDYFQFFDAFRSRKINNWIRKMIRNRVEHLELHLYPQEDDYEVRPMVFASNYLRVLKLISMDKLEKRVTVGTLTRCNFCSLEVLHLEYVYFSDLRILELVLSSCASLKDLRIKFSDEDDYDLLNVERLNNLVTADVPQSLLPLEALSNVTYLRLYRPWDSNLDTCPFTDDMPVFYNLTHLECTADEWTKMINCLVNFPKLQKLVIKKLFFSAAPERIPDVPPCVSFNLKHLTVNYEGGIHSIFEMVNYMVKNGRVLKTVKFNWGDYGFECKVFQELAASLISGSELGKQPLVVMFP